MEKNEENIVKQRIKEILSDNNVSQNKLSGEDKALQKRLSNQINSDTKLSVQTLLSIVDKIPSVSMEWLLKGEGSRYTTKDSPSIPLIPTLAKGGALSGFMTDGTMIADCERVISPFQRADLAVEVYGDSMYPEYPSGSRLFVKKIKEGSFIKWGDVYVLDTCNGTIIKVVQPSDDGESIRCLSLNPNGRYKPFDVSKEDIFGIYQVLGCLIIK